MTEGMDAEPTKRRGLIGLLLGSRRFRWSAAAVLLLPMLYVLSSGLTIPVAQRIRVEQFELMKGYPVTRKTNETDQWWLTVYGPLIRICGHRWAKPLLWYWQQFSLHEVPAADINASGTISGKGS